MKINKVLLTSILVSLSSQVLAEGITTAASSPQQSITAPNDLHDWTGDLIQLHANTTGFVKDANQSSYSAPDGSKLMVTQENPINHKLRVKFRKVESENASFTETSVNTNEVFVIDKSEIEKMPHSRAGWTFGALVIPFKYHPSDKSFGGSASIGPYVGYRISPYISGLYGTSATWIASAGWTSSIAVPTAPNVTPAGSVNRSGFSFSTGLIFSVDKGEGIQVGILAGQDRMGSNAIAPYSYEGKTWISMAVGYKFF